MMQYVIQRDLELQDTAQSLLERKRRMSERCQCPKRAMSPFELAVQRAQAQSPPRWNKRPHPLGLAVTELKAASALLILHQHALLMEDSAEGFGVSKVW
jgi:hypothetical protein